MLYQLSYCPQWEVPAYQHPHNCEARLPRSMSAGLLVDRVTAVVTAVLVHFEALTIVDLGFHRDVVAPLALGALEGDLHPLVGLGHFRTSFSSR
jgi:hypothetical protein